MVGPPAQFSRKRTGKPGRRWPSEIKEAAKRGGLQARKSRRSARKSGRAQQCAHQQRPRGPQTRRWNGPHQRPQNGPQAAFSIGVKFCACAGIVAAPREVWASACLLYTSDAADEEDSVDLGG